MKFSSFQTASALILAVRALASDPAAKPPDIAENKISPTVTVYHVASRGNARKEEPAARINCTAGKSQFFTQDVSHELVIDLAFAEPAQAVKLYKISNAAPPEQLPLEEDDAVQILAKVNAARMCGSATDPIKKNVQAFVGDFMQWELPPTNKAQTAAVKEAPRP